MNIEVEGNDPIEENHNDEEDHDDQDDHNDQDDDDDDDGDIDIDLDVTILEKEHETLYEGSQTTLLAIVFLLVNLKVVNDLSNVAMTCMLRYVIFFHFFSCNSPTIKIG